MPFSWFGGSSNPSPSTQASDLSGGRGNHSRKVSLSSSSSGDHSSRLANVRAKAKSSYLRKEMTQSGELSSSRGKRLTHSTHSNPTTTNTTSRMMKINQAIVAVEPSDSDYSEQSRRIDQGLIDASREAQNQVLEPQSKLTSWWALPAFTAPAPAPAAPSLPQVAPMPVNPTIETGGSSANNATAKHRRTVSYNKTYRVP